MVRLGERVPPLGAETVLDASGDLSKPITLGLSSEAAEVGGIELRIAGPSRQAALNWRRAGEHGFLPGRRLLITLDPSGAPHTYQVHLAREEQWIGRIAALRIASTSGPARLLGVTLHKPRSALRPLDLRGVSLPSLVRDGRFEIPLTGDLPRPARLEVSLGILPEFQREGAKGCFSIATIGPGGDGARRPLYDQCIPSGGPEIAGWVPVRLDLDLPAEGRLVFDAHVEVGGTRLEAGALWGQPILFARRAAPGKNLVLVVVDTLRTDALGAYGNRQGLTPNLDALARRSVRLAQLHAPAPWTLPSMASLMTGLQPQTHGAGRRLGEEAPTGFADGLHTLAWTLASQGFYTSGIYKNIYLNPEFGLSQGFDLYASHETMPGEAGASREANAGFLVDRAIEELARIEDRRFFLYLHLFDPHNPYEAPREWCDRVARRLEPGYRGPLGCRVDRRPEGPLPAPSDFAWIRALYDAEVAYTDHELGRFFAALHDRGLDRNTVLAFASDHGEEFYDRLDQERRLGYEPNSDHGHTHYEELLHVPGMIAAPGLGAGVVADPVQTVDLFPTLLSLAGVQPPPSEGQNLSAALAGAGSGSAEAPRPTPAALISGLILHGLPRQAIRRAQWKLIQPRRKTLPIELYDLSADPGETRDLSAARPDVVQGLRSLLAAQLDARRKLRLQILASD